MRSIESSRFLVCTLALLAGCGRDSASHELGAGPQRLAERLDSARIDSPLVGLQAASDLSKLAGATATPLLAEDFATLEVAAQAWPGMPDARTADEDGNRYLQVQTIGWQDTLSWAFPARTEAFYRFERSIRLHGPAVGDVYVVESRLPPSADVTDPLRNRLAGRGAALRVHGLELHAHAEVGAQWQKSSVTFHPSPHTRSLVVLVRPRSDAGDVVGGSPIDVDDVRLEEFVPTPIQRAALLKASDAAPEANVELGMLKQGLLLPLPAVDSEQGLALEANYTWRRALYAPPPTDIAFELDIPQSARLRLGCGLSRATPPGSAASFEVELRPAGDADARLLLADRRDAQFEDWRWSEHELDLSAFAGRRATLTLRTRALQGDPHPLWAEPRLESAAQNDQPLVILIAVDTLRADRLGCYGHGRPTSPAIDALASDGIRFSAAYANANWTCPSFASIFTGLVPSRHGVTSYGPATPLPDELLTLAEIFRARGWSTHSIAYKVPLYDGGYEQGFEEAFNAPRDVVRGEENLAYALDWLDHRPSGPGFLFLHFNDPHVPYKQPEPYDRLFGPPATALGRSLPLSISDPRLSASPEPLRGLVNDLYDGSVAYVDHCIGRFLDALRERGLYERALVAFVSDHGEQLWEHGRFGHGEEALWQEVVRVPLIVKPSKGTFETGRTLDAPVSAFDLMPTLLELAGLARPENLDARSLVPLLQGAATSLGVPAVSETSSGSLSVVQGTWKYSIAIGASGVERLFDLSRDPGERTDLSSTLGDQLESMRRLAAAYLVAHRPGAYLLARTGEEPLSARVRGAGVERLIGSIAIRADSDVTHFELPPRSWALVRWNVTGEPSFEGMAAPSDGEPAGGADAVARCLAGETAGVWRLQGPAPAAVEARDSLDLSQLEALRALGYAR